MSFTWPEGEGLLYEQRSLAHVAPSERKRLAWAQSGIGQGRYERRVLNVAAAEEMRANRFDDGRRERPDVACSPLARLANGSDGLGRDACQTTGRANTDWRTISVFRMEAGPTAAAWSSERNVSMS